jgi:hypothetical protein
MLLALGCSFVVRQQDAWQMFDANDSGIFAADGVAPDGDVHVRIVGVSMDSGEPVKFLDF